jgi:hypothetical protein
MFPSNQCPRCGSAIEEDTIACSKCKTVVRFFCDTCNKPVLINSRQCPSCGADNENYDQAFDKVQGASEAGPATGAMESQFDDESSDIAKEIAELKGELGKSEMAEAFSAARSKPAKPGKPGKPGQPAGGLDVEVKPFDVAAAPATDDAHLLIQSMATSSADLQPEQEKPVQKVLSAWDCDVIVHSKNNKEPVHVGLGTDPWKARGISGTIMFTQSAVIFITYIPQIRNINDVFAYVSFNIGTLNDYHLDPDMSRNYLVFNSTGLFKKKFPGTLAINVHFTWSKVAADGDVQNQMFQFKSLIERLKLFKKAESKLLSGDYMFTQGKKPADHPEIRDILEELKGIPSVHEIIKDRYPSLGKL